MQRVHVIGIGGSVMHALAIQLRRQGYQVTGSDDRLEDPARSCLAAEGLLPARIGWDPDHITPAIDLVIVGKHAAADNPELVQAKALGRPIVDMPTFISQFAAQKHRISVVGSHGKTTTTALLTYAFRQLGLPTDWLAGAPPPDTELTLSLSEAPTIILEGDEYPASAYNLQPKAAVYRPHWLICTGIAWDHANAYPTPESYEAAFAFILAQLPKGGLCVYNQLDPRLRSLVEKQLRPGHHHIQPYGPLPYFIREGVWYVRVGRRVAPLHFWGRYNLLNVSAVWKLLQQIWVEDKAFAEILSTFRLPAGRQVVWHRSPQLVVVRDFAHAPSKVTATLQAVQETFPSYTILSVLELHTYSSLMPAFARQYRAALRKAHERWFYVEPLVAQSKGLDSLASLQAALRLKRALWFTDRETLISALKKRLARGPLVVVLMSSGTLAGLKPADLGLAN